MNINKRMNKNILYHYKPEIRMNKLCFRQQHKEIANVRLRKARQIQKNAFNVILFM